MIRVAIAILILLCAPGCGGGDDDDDTAPDAASADATGASIDAAGVVDAATPDAFVPGACGTAGTGQVNGSVLGRNVEPVARSNYFEHPLATGVYVILLDEAAGACAATSSTGQHLALLLPCGPAEVGTYPIATKGGAPDCASEIYGFALLEEDGGMDVATSTGGEISITEVGACVTGTFSLDFDGGESMTGGFSAVACPIR